jgi:hypothetical protein
MSIENPEFHEEQNRAKGEGKAAYERYIKEQIRASKTLIQEAKKLISDSIKIDLKTYVDGYFGIDDINNWARGISDLLDVMAPFMPLTNANDKMSFLLGQRIISADSITSINWDQPNSNILKDCARNLIVERNRVIVLIKTIEDFVESINPASS